MKPDVKLIWLRRVLMLKVVGLLLCGLALATLPKPVRQPAPALKKPKATGQR